MARNVWWLVTLASHGGQTCTVRVFALNRGDAEYRAAVEAEEQRGFSVARVVVARPTS